METDFNPVYPVYYEVFSEQQAKEVSKVFFFGDGTEIKEAKGKLTGLVKKGSIDEYLVFQSGDEVRIDRIISINGVPGPAYNEYDAFALACLSCNAGAE